MSNDAEPSVLDYARYYGLSKNHLEVDPLQPGLLPPPDEPESPLQLDTETPWLQLNPNITTPPPERLTAVKETSTLLAIVDPKQYGDSLFDTVNLIPTYRVRHAKIELPLLHSDHEMDMLDFLHRSEPNLAQEFIPFEKVDDEQDEGLTWPSYCYTWPEWYFEKAQNEKLEVARDVLAYMNAALDARPKIGEIMFEYDWPIARRSALRDPITPPLLPRSPSPQPFEPSSETGHLDFLSDHSSPTRQALDRIDTIIIRNDSLTSASSCSNEAVADPGKLGTNSIGDLYSPLKAIHVAPSPPRLKRKRTQDLKIDGPLTPTPSHRPPPWDEHNTSLADLLGSGSPALSLPYPQPEQTSLDDIEMLFAEHIAPRAAKAEREIEQEQLQEADTTCRVPVPTMDFSKPIPPWDEVGCDTIGEGRMQFLREIKETYLSVPPWRLDGSVTRELSWRPFSSSQGNYQIQETIEDDGSLASFIAQPDRMDLDTLMWKPPGLRIMDEIHDPDEEELTYGEYPPARDVQSLIKKRNFELLNNGGTSTQEFQDVGEDAQKRERPRSARLEQHEIAAEADFSAMNALDEFLGLRTGKIKRIRGATECAPEATAPQVAAESVKPIESTENKAAKVPMPTPQPDVPTTRIFLVVSTSFLSDRELACRVQSLCPSAVFIERDLALHSSRALHQGTSHGRHRKNAEVTSEEADIIVSPNTGLILTSLPKIKQQALPGQAMHSPLRERIRRVANRYERLILVVSHAAITPDMDSELMGNLDESDYEALVSMTAFLSHLTALSESELLFVDGATSVMAQWIVALMVKHSARNSTGMLEEETQWEVFLRHAGMNAFAAQAVLGELKLLGERKGGAWGLRDFVLMSPGERSRRFEGVLGGTRLLERVGKVLDACWYSGT